MIAAVSVRKAPDALWGILGNGLPGSAWMRRSSGRLVVSAADALLVQSNWRLPRRLERARRDLQPQAAACEARYGAVATAHTVITAAGSIANQTDVSSPTRHTRQLSTASDHATGST